MFLAMAMACGHPAGPRPRLNWTEVEVDLERRCQGGTTSACGQLGRVLVEKYGKGPDLQRGLVLLETACGQDDVPACAFLGNTYFNRFGDRAASARARDLLSGACQRRFASACSGLGRLVLGDGGQDVSEAKGLYRTGCELGDAEGCARLALLEGGDEFGGSRTRADDALTRACQLGRLSSCQDLAVGALGHPGKQEEAVRLLVQTCHRGHAGSCLSAAHVFAPIASPRANCDQALPLARKACQGGEEDGCATVEACRLPGPERGPALEQLRRGCERRNGLACLYWAEAHADQETENDRRRGAYMTACRAGYGEAQYLACGRLGAMELTRAKTRPEAEQAVKMLEEACEHASGQACCDLAEAYREGTGVSTSAARATELKAKACQLEEKRCCGR
jgi:uncharacterized protein